MADQRQAPIEFDTILAWILAGLAFFGVISWLNAQGDTPSHVPTVPIVNPLLPTNRPMGIDLDCVDVGQQVYVGAYDPNKLDADGDGIGCEGW